MYISHKSIFVVKHAISFQILIWSTRLKPLIDVFYEHAKITLIKKFGTQLNTICWWFQGYCWKYVEIVMIFVIKSITPLGKVVIAALVSVVVVVVRTVVTVCIIGGGLVWSRGVWCELVTSWIMLISWSWSELSWWVVLKSVIVWSDVVVVVSEDKRPGIGVCWYWESWIWHVTYWIEIITWFGVKNFTTIPVDGINAIVVSKIERRLLRSHNWIYCFVFRAWSISFSSESSFSFCWRTIFFSSLSLKPFKNL